MRVSEKATVNNTPTSFQIVSIANTSESISDGRSSGLLSFGTRQRQRRGGLRCAGLPHGLGFRSSRHHDSRHGFVQNHRERSLRRSKVFLLNPKAHLAELKRWICVRFFTLGVVTPKSTFSEEALVSGGFPDSSSDASWN